MEIRGEMSDFIVELLIRGTIRISDVPQNIRLKGFRFYTSANRCCKYLSDEKDFEIFSDMLQCLYGDISYLKQSNCDPRLLELFEEHCEEYEKNLISKNNATSENLQGGYQHGD